MFENEKMFSQLYLPELMRKMVNFLHYIHTQHFDNTNNTWTNSILSFIFSGEFTWKHKFTHVDARCHVVPTIIRYSYLCRYLCKVHIPILSLYDSLFFLQVVKCKGLTRAWCKRDIRLTIYIPSLSVHITQGQVIIISFFPRFQGWCC